MYSSFLEAARIDWKQFEANNVHDAPGTAAAAAAAGRSRVDRMVEDMQLSSDRGSYHRLGRPVQDPETRR